MRKGEGEGEREGDTICAHRRACRVRFQTVEKVEGKEGKGGRKRATHLRAARHEREGAPRVAGVVLQHLHHAVDARQAPLPLAIPVPAGGRGAGGAFFGVAAVAEGGVAPGGEGSVALDEHVGGGDVHGLLEDTGPEARRLRLRLAGRLRGTGGGGLGAAEIWENGKKMCV